ncbi:MAG: hypothetical protein WCP22_01605 [Chlamydiota bacterium]
MNTIFVWGDDIERVKDKLVKIYKMKWSRSKKRFFREKLDARGMKAIMNFCLKEKINYKTDDGKSYEVVKAEEFDTSPRELKDWAPDVSKVTTGIEEIDYEQMWDEHKEEE